MDDRSAIGFEENRAHLRSVAARMLGSAAEADDAVQETWLRLTRADTSGVHNLGGWLTTVVSRVCLDMLRSRTARRENPLGGAPVASVEAGARRSASAPADPEREALLADSIGPALLVVLDTLAPAERLAFVLHDLFAVPFEEIAPIVGRSPAATRQLASRARRRVQGRAQQDPDERMAADEGPAATRSAAGSESDPDADSAGSDVSQLDTAIAAVDVARRRQIVDAFLAASRRGDFAALLAALDPDVVLRADAAAARSGAEPEVLGAHAVAATFSGRARAARPALIDGAPGLVWAPGGEPRVVFGFTISDDRIVAIDLLADPDLLAGMDVVITPL